MEYNYTKPRIPISAMYASPGPCYALRTLVGYEGHDPRSVHYRAPAYGFDDNCSPGPCYFPDPKMYNNEKDGSPHWSLAMRLDDLNFFRTSSPFAYRPEDAKRFVFHTYPEYSFGIRHRNVRSDNTPAPNAYTLNHMIGHTIQRGKPQVPCYSLTKRLYHGIFLDNHAKIQRQLKHSSVVELYDFYVISNHNTIVMESCYNGNLRHLLTVTPGSMLSECFCRRCLRHMLKVVTYLLHSQRIVPRDFDFFIDQPNCVSLVDFSSARNLTSEDELSMARHGTDGHWLLEVIARLSYNPRTADVCGVPGVTLNILLTSRFPFSGNDRQVLAGIQKGIDLRKGMSVHLSKVVSDQFKGRLHYVIHVSAHFPFGEFDWCDSVDLDTDSSGGDGASSTSLRMISCASSEAIEGGTMAVEHQQDTSMEPPFGLGVQHQHPVVHRFMVDISETPLLLTHRASSSYTVRDTTSSTSGMGVAKAVSVAVGVAEAVGVATRRKSVVLKFDCELGDAWIVRERRPTVAWKTDTDKLRMTCVWMRILFALCLLHVATAWNDKKPARVRYTFKWSWRVLILPFIGALTWIRLVPTFLRVIGFGRNGLRPGSLGAKLHYAFNITYRRYAFMFRLVNRFHSIGMKGLDSFYRVLIVGTLGFVFGVLVECFGVYMYVRNQN